MSDSTHNQVIAEQFARQATPFAEMPIHLSDNGQVLEDRYLFWGTTYLNHMTSNGTANVVYLHVDGRERSAEVESCLLPPGK